MRWFFGPCFLIGGNALVMYRREFMELGRSMTVKRWQPLMTDAYMGWMRRMVAVLGALFALVGLLLLAGVFHPFSD